MMAERAVPVDHTTIYRWVQKYAPELHKKNRFYDVVDTKECNLVHRDFEIIRNGIIDFVREKNYSLRYCLMLRGILTPRRT